MKFQKQNKLKTLFMAFVISLFFTAFGVFNGSVNNTEEIIMSIIGMSVIIFIVGYFANSFKPSRTEVFSGRINSEQHKKCRLNCGIFLFPH